MPKQRIKFPKFADEGDHEHFKTRLRKLEEKLRNLRRRAGCCGSPTYDSCSVITHGTT